MKRASEAAVVVFETGSTSIITDLTDTGDGKVIEVIDTGVGVEVTAEKNT